MRWDVFVLCAVTTILLQVLSNFANDYGDSQHGADNADRVGPSRAVQRGDISSSQMKKAMILTGILSFISGCTLLYISGLHFDLQGSFFLVLGIAAIAAAIRYTAGKDPYGYKGLGDFFVFLFFGLVGVLGSSFLHDLVLPSVLEILPAICIGAWSAGVLNLNNMRDRVPDEAAGKITLAVRFGAVNAKKYHQALILTGMCSLLLFLLSHELSWTSLLPLLSFPLFLKHLNKVRSTTEDKALDPELKKLALSTFLMSLLLFVAALLTT
jgi:1,4-dihydroxy-2-naphthoate octaprenyltransferase